MECMHKKWSYGQGTIIFFFSFSELAFCLDIGFLSFVWNWIRYI